MPLHRIVALAAALSVCATTLGSIAVATGDTGGAGRPKGRLAAFASDKELNAFLAKLRKRQQRQLNMEPVADAAPPAMIAAPPPSLDTASQAVAGESLDMRTASITNNQTAGVDEGGIVKVRGSTLVILRRGRLFTVSLSQGGMRPVDAVNAFAPDVSGEGDWYDEMLIAGDRVIVVGYSYERGGTEINRFRLSPEGRLRFEDAWHLNANDYYSSRNYASRLIGNRLVFYTPLYLGWEGDPTDALPGVRRWQGQRGPRGFKRIASARDIHIAPGLRESDEADLSTLHSVTSCDLSAAALDCSAVGVIGPPSRTFYVSGSAVYLWMSDSWSPDARRRAGARAFLYRLPLNPGERPSAVAARGAPVDQFSFREDPGAGMLNVLLRSEGGGDWMFDPERSGGEVALLRLSLSDLGDGSREVARSRYRALPGLKGEGWNFHNRFVGNHVLYGGGEFGRAGSAALIAASLTGPTTTRIPLPHAVDRIEALGRDAMVIGGGAGGLGFSAVGLTGNRPRLGDLYVHPDATEGETRSHAFFFRADPGTPDGASGLIGLPVARPADPAVERFFGSSAAMLFLRRLDRRLSPAGELEAKVRAYRDDACMASCVDWYGNARPIFLGSRTFALLGYELVEGRLAGGRIREVGRVDFSPRPPPRRGS